MIQEILLILDVIGLGMLLGGGVYESVIINPNCRANIPHSLNHLRSFMSVTSPAYLFRVLSPFTMIILLLTVFICWDVISIRWWVVTSFALLIVADTITYSIHYPRNRILFVDPLIPDIDLLKKLAHEWQLWNFVRILLMASAVVTLACGIFSTAKP